MIYIDLLFAALVALLIAAVLIGVVGWRHPRQTGAGPAALFLFVFLLAVIWAGGVWSTPYGPPLWGSYWLPFLIVGLVSALIILALSPDARLPGEAPQVPPGPTDTEIVTAGILGLFGIFFWILLFAAALAVMLRYLT